MLKLLMKKKVVTPLAVLQYGGKKILQIIKTFI